MKADPKAVQTDDRTVDLTDRLKVGSLDLSLADLSVDPLAYLLVGMTVDQ